MVINATSLTRSGLTDFLIQRLTAIILGLYGLCIVGFLLAHPDLRYSDWVGFMRSPSMTIFSTVTLLSVCAHAWIGMWIVGTDYLSESQLGSWATFCRLTYQCVVSLLIVIFAIWGLAVILGFHL